LEIDIQIERNVANPDFERVGVGMNVVMVGVFVIG
jgi:hypothetical protein